MASNKKELARQMKDVRTAIRSGRVAVDGLFREYGRAIAQLRDAEKRHGAASAKYIRKPNDSNRLARDSAFEMLELALREVRGQRDRLHRYRDDLLSAYKRLGELTLQGGNVKGCEAGDEREGFLQYFNNKIAAMEQGLLISRPSPAAQHADESAEQAEEMPSDRRVSDMVALNLPGDNDEKQAPRATPQRSAAPAVGVASVNIAPISIDVSDIVRQAVSSVVDKLNLSLKEKITEAVGAIELPAATAAAEPVRAEAVCPDLGGLTAEIELAARAISELVQSIEKIESRTASLTERLDVLSQRAAQIDLRTAEAVSQPASDNTSLISLGGEREDLAKLSEELAQQISDITASLNAAAESQRSIALMQKETAELQKKTVRLQQGIRVGQKLLDADGAEVVFKKTEDTDKRS